VVRERSAKPLYVGSIPTRASTSFLRQSKSLTVWKLFAVLLQCSQSTITAESDYFPIFLSLNLTQPAVGTV
jgi:hypothetical protein